MTFDEYAWGKNRRGLDKESIGTRVWEQMRVVFNDAYDLGRRSVDEAEYQRLKRDNTYLANKEAMQYRVIAEIQRLAARLESDLEALLRDSGESE